MHLATTSKITMFAHFRNITEIVKKLRVYTVLGDAVTKL